VGVQEVRWDGGGTEPAGQYIFFCWKVNQNRELGTSFFVHKKIISAVKRVEFVRDSDDQWKKSIIVPVHKKSDKTDCSSYRGISLLSTSYKILSIILLSILSPYTDEIIGDHQCGFRRNRSTTDQIFYTRQILKEHNLNSCGLHIGDINCFCIYLTNRLCYVPFPREFCRSFTVLSGVPRGFVVRTLLFYIYIHDLCIKIKLYTFIPLPDDFKIYFSNFFLICIVRCGIKVHSTMRPLNGLLCQPRVIMIMEKSVE
jgi:hypothetical protein